MLWRHAMQNRVSGAHFGVGEASKRKIIIIIILYHVPLGQSWLVGFLFLFRCVLPFDEYPTVLWKNSNTHEPGEDTDTPKLPKLVGTFGETVELVERLLNETHLGVAHGISCLKN